VIVPLSARDPERLTVKTRDLLKWLEVRLEASDFGIDDVAWTLQMGREAMTARLAVVATGLADAVAELRHRLEEGPTARGSPASRHAVVPWPRTVMDLEDLRAMAEAWEAGGTVDWRALWGDAEPRRIPLPLYPFKPTSYWQRARRGTTPSLDAQTTDRSPDAVVAPDLMLSRIEQFLLEWASQETAIAVEEIATDRTFFELGLRSASLVRMLQGLEDEFGLDVEASVPFEHSTIFDLSRFLVRADVRHGEV
jgi:acyl transferase domain-containing protein